VTPFTSHLSVKKCGRSPASSRAAAVYSEVLVRLLASLDAQDRPTSLVFELPPSADRQDCWHIYYGDVHAGTIAKRVGSPHVTDQWEWRCGFYPGSRPGEIRSGTAATFDYARDEFGGAWKIFFANRTDAGFQAWRHQRDWTERKYAIWKRGELLPSQKPDTMMRCPCGITFDSHYPAGSYVHRQHIYAKQAGIADGATGKDASPSHPVSRT
jgi:hypothetical protein